MIEWLHWHVQMCSDRRPKSYLLCQPLGNGKGLLMHSKSQTTNLIIIESPHVLSVPN